MVTYQFLPIRLENHKNRKNKYFRIVWELLTLMCILVFAPMGSAFLKGNWQYHCVYMCTPLHQSFPLVGTCSSCIKRQAQGCLQSLICNTRKLETMPIPNQKKKKLGNIPIMQFCIPGHLGSSVGWHPTLAHVMITWSMGWSPHQALC